MRRTLVLVIILSLAAPACSGGSVGTKPSPRRPRIDVDPRSYYDDYREAAEDDATSGGRSSPTGGVGAEPGPVVVPTPVPGLGEDNTFVDPGTNPFVITKNDPRSTFAMDVDTGSFSVGRTFLDQGHLPPPASVRTEEWVNAFSYGDAAPTLETLAINVDGGPAPFAHDGTRLVRVGVASRRITDEERPDANLTLVVDISGSMDIRERLGLVRSSLALLALNLRDSDTISVVTYGTDAGVLLPPTPLSEAGRIVDAIDGLQPEGSTNMEAGLRLGYRQARKAFQPGEINTVVLASDGVANTGTTSVEGLSRMIRSQSGDGIHLVTVGYGMGNYNDALMEQLADRGDGFYRYVDTYAEAKRLFTTDLTSTLAVVAEDAKAQVTFDPEKVDSYRLVGYENRAIDDGRFDDGTVDAGELGAGHHVTALYEVHLTDGAAGKLGSITVRYTSPGSGEAAVQDAAIDAGAIAATFDTAPSDVRLAATVAAFAELMAGHPLPGQRGVTLQGLATMASSLAKQGVGVRDPSGGASAADLAKLTAEALTSKPMAAGTGG